MTTDGARALALAAVGLVAMALVGAAPGRRISRCSPRRESPTVR
jgi:hypothetical protein